MNEDKLYSLLKMIECFSNLPEHMMHQPVTQYELKVVLELLYDILKKD